MPASALRKLGPLISAIGVEFQQKWKQPEQGGHQHRAAVTILNFDSVHDRPQHQPLRINQDVSLLALDLLPASNACGSRSAVQTYCAESMRNALCRRMIQSLISEGGWTWPTRWFP
jgi:hypothetical protein